MTCETTKKGFRHRPYVVIGASITLVLVNAKLGFEASTQHERIQLRSKLSGGELEALRLIPELESQLQELAQQRELITGTAPQSK